MRWMPLLMAGAVLAGCTPQMQEDINYAWFKEQQRWNARDRTQDFRDLFAVDEVYPSYAHQEREADREVCFHPNSQRRVVTQNGVSDQIDYTWCVLQPYDDTLGQRLDGRPAVGGNG